MRRPNACRTWRDFSARGGDAIYGKEKGRASLARPFHVHALGERLELQIEANVRLTAEDVIVRRDRVEGLRA